MQAAQIFRVPSRLPPHMLQKLVPPIRSTFPVENSPWRALNVCPPRILPFSFRDYLEHEMNREWNDNQPIYRQLRDRGVHMILDGVLKEGDPLPSVRNVAAEYRVNPLTVLKAYQQLVDEDLVEMKRGLGMFVKAGARELLLKG